MTQPSPKTDFYFRGKLIGFCVHTGSMKYEVRSETDNGLSIMPQAKTREEARRSIIREWALTNFQAPKERDKWLKAMLEEVNA